MGPTRTANPDDLLELAERLASDPSRRVELLQKLLGEAACRAVGIYPIPPGFKLSVVIPVYNEERWLGELVRRVQAVEIPKELILVNDFSTDGTPAILKQLESQYDNVRVFHQPRNRARGPRFARVSSTAPATSSSSRMPTGNTTRPSTPSSSSRSSRAAPMSSSARASSARATACSTTGTRWPTGC